VLAPRKNETLDVVTSKHVLLCDSFLTLVTLLVR